MGESAGADKAIVQASAVGTFNDLRGKAVAYSDSSVSEYLLYYMLRVGGVPVGEVTRFGQENLNQAVRRYLAREAHGVVGWSSGDLTEAEQRGRQHGADGLRPVPGHHGRGGQRLALPGDPQGGRCRPSTTPGSRPPKMTIEQPDRAAQAMARWSASWTGVGSPQDLRDALEEFAQATLQDNQAVLARPEPAPAVRALQGGPDGLALRRAGGAARPAGRRAGPGLRPRLRARRRPPSPP